jgi:hypothetical protein
MDDSEQHSNLYKKLKPFILSLLVIAALAVGIWQMLREQTYVISALGMDDMGRQAFVQLLNSDSEDADDIKMICEGPYNQVIVVSMKNAAPIIFGRIKPDDVPKHMRKPYAVALEGFKGLILRGDEMARRLDDPIPIEKIFEKLQDLGAKTIGDFYAVCGFEKFIIRDEENGTLYLNLKFSSDNYGNNPLIGRLDS